MERPTNCLCTGPPCPSGKSLIRERLQPVPRKEVDFRLFPVLSFAAAQRRVVRRPLPRTQLSTDVQFSPCTYVCSFQEAFDKVTYCHAARWVGHDYFSGIISADHCCIVINGLHPGSELGRLFIERLDHLCYSLCLYNPCHLAKLSDQLSEIWIPLDFFSLTERG